LRLPGLEQEEEVVARQQKVLQYESSKNFDSIKFDVNDKFEGEPAPAAAWRSGYCVRLRTGSNPFRVSGFCVTQNSAVVKLS
jgi:hypothetical protein